MKEETNMTKKQKQRLSCFLTILLVGLGLGNKQEINTWFAHLQSDKTVQTVRNPLDSKNEQKQRENHGTATTSIDQQQYDQLAALDFHSGDNAVLNVNNGQSTLDISQWQENKVIYGDLDPLNRTTVVTAYLDKQNLGRSEGRERQVWQPTGWHQKQVDGKEIVNRGHLLAYTSSFNFEPEGNFKKGELGSQDNPKNLATQTAFSNQKVQTTYEKLVREAQKTNGNKVVYQIVTVFRGNERMPRGYWLQAIDSAGTLNFNIYEYNVQPNVVFHYEDGTSKIDRTMKVSWEL
ncbi:DNA-entry nuclease [Enterococcus canintestini]|nr:DNA-entry nuclease [Enterococcus canintestini]